MQRWREVEMKVKSDDAFRLQVRMGTLRPRHLAAERAGVPVRNEGMWEIKKKKRKSIMQ